MRATEFGGFLLGLILLVPSCQWVLGDFKLDKSSTCTRGQMQCVGTVLQTCNEEGNAWSNSSVCASETLCDAAHGVCQRPTCAAGERHCQDAEFQICNATRDGWTDVQMCGSASRCSAEGGCTGDPCQPGTRQCNGAALRECANDDSGWSPIDTCLSATLCSPNGCMMGVCMPGQLKCENAALEVCNDTLDGFTTLKTCDSATLCDAMAGMCRTAGCTTPGAFRCGPTGVLERCADDLTSWVTIAMCKGAAFCDSLQGKCSDEPCNPGAYQCSGAKLEVCAQDSSGWRQLDSCETEGLCQQTLTLGATTCEKPVCSPGATQCAGAEPQVCNADRTAFKTNGPACASAALCNAVTGTCSDPKCIAGQLRCDPANPVSLERCNDDLTDWDPTPCDTCATAELCAASLGATTCDATSCQEPVCDVGAPHCGGTGSDAGKLVEMCNTARTGYTPCDTCDTVELCSLSLNTKPFACTATACTAPSCNSTDLWCGGTNNTGLYQCPPSRINSQATLLDTCVTNGLCELSHSKNETKCEAPTCALTDTWCGGSGNTALYQCPASRINSQATVLDTCATSGLCDLTHSKNETKCEAPTCTAGALFCGGTGNKSLYQCPTSRISSQAAVLDTCLTSGLCDLTRSKNETKCEAAACATGDTRCSGTAKTTLQMCNSDRTGFSDCDTCSSAQLCTDSLGAKSCNSSACLACATDEVHCDDAGNYETCKTDRTGFQITDCMGLGCDVTMGGCLQ